MASLNAAVKHDHINPIISTLPIPLPLKVKKEKNERFKTAAMVKRQEQRKHGSRVSCDFRRAVKMGRIITIANLPVNVEYSLRRRKSEDSTKPVPAYTNSLPKGLWSKKTILSQVEHDSLVTMVNKVSRDKRSPWSSEGFGGNYQKTYYVTDDQVNSILKYGYTWNKRRMKFQTLYNPEPDMYPGDFMLARNIERKWPKETLTQRIQRLATRPGYTLDLLALQANWMQGTDFPTHKDRARMEGWGDVIVSLSLNSGGNIVFKHPSCEVSWTMPIECRDVYAMREEVRWDWEHGFVADNAFARISLIWRFREYRTDIPLEDQPTRLDTDL